MHHPSQEPIWCESKIYGEDRGFLKVAPEIVGSVVSRNNGTALSLSPSFFLGGNSLYVGQIDKAKEGADASRAARPPKKAFFAHEGK